MVRRGFLVCLLLAFAVSAGAEGPRILKSRAFEARLEQFTTVERGSTMPLKLFADATYDAVIEERQTDRRGNLVLRGHLAEYPGSWLVLIERRGVLAGVVATGERLFRVRYVGEGLHAIDEFDPRSLEPPGDDAMYPDLEGYVATGAVGSGQNTVAAPGIERAAAGKSVIDVLFLYTQKSAKKVLEKFWVDTNNAKEAIESQIELSVAVMSAAVKNSKVKAKVRLVGIEKINGKGSGKLSKDIRALTNAGDGKFETAQPLREQYGADFVVLVVAKDKEGFAGRGWQLPASDPSSPNLAYSVVVSGSLWWMTVAHEIGHNMGLGHDPSNDTLGPGARSYSYSQGFRNEAKGLATLMAYTTGCAACWNTIPHYSNKKVKWRGRSQPSDPDLIQPGCKGNEPIGGISFPVCGTKTGSNKANTAKSVNKTRNIFAKHRECKVDC